MEERCRRLYALLEQITTRIEQRQAHGEDFALLESRFLRLLAAFTAAAERAN